MLQEAHSYASLIFTATWYDQFNQNVSRLVSGGEDKTVQIWDITGAHIATYDKHTAPITTVASSRYPADMRIASGSDDGTVHIWTPIP
jgi:WD40 repeat protein